MSLARSLACSILTLSLAAGAFAGVGDVVELTLLRGEKVKGTVVEETDFKYVIKLVIANIPVEKTYAKSEVRSARLVEDAAKKELEAFRAGEPLPTKDSDPDLPRDDSGDGGYTIVPARGAFGEEVNADYFRDALERAADKGAEAVVFHLESPGGYVFVLDEIRDTIDEFEDRMDIAVYIDGDCFSAAAMLAMSTEHFYIGPKARCGAAVGFVQADSGNIKVDAKFNSALAAKWRARAESSKRPGLVIDAMILPEAEVYADTTTSPWTLSNTAPGDMTEQLDDGTLRYRLIDSDKAILSFTHNEAIDMGIVNGSARTPDDVIGLLDLKNPDRIAYDGGDFWETYNRRYRTNTKAVDNAIEDYFAAGEIADTEDTLYGLKSKVREMSRNINKAARLAEQYSYVRVRLEEQGITIENLKAEADRLSRYIARINRAQ